MNAVVVDTRTTNIGDYLQFEGIIKFLKENFKVQNIFSIPLSSPLDSCDLSDYDIIVFYGSILTEILSPENINNMKSDINKFDQIFLGIGLGVFSSLDGIIAIGDLPNKYLKKLNEIFRIYVRGYATLGMIKKFNIDASIFGDIVFHSVENQFKFSKDIQNIVISIPPDLPQIYCSFIYNKIVEKFPNGNIYISYNQYYDIPIEKYFKNSTIVKFDNNINKFKNFMDDMDLHVGFRVHSHYYSIARGIPSILFTRDSRGLDSGSMVDKIGNNIIFGLPEWFGNFTVFLDKSIDRGFSNFKELNDIVRDIKSLGNKPLNDFNNYKNVK